MECWTTAYAGLKAGALASNFRPPILAPASFLLVLKVIQPRRPLAVLSAVRMATDETPAAVVGEGAAVLLCTPSVIPHSPFLEKDV